MIIIGGTIEFSDIESRDKAVEVSKTVAAGCA